MEYHLNCSDLCEPAQMHQALAEALSLPEWYGHNLDALFDCLTELSEPVCLMLEHWDPFLPWASGFEAVFTDAQADNPNFRIIFSHS